MLFLWFTCIINISPFLDIIADMDLFGSILFPVYGGQVLLRRRIRYGMFPTVNVVFFFNIQEKKIFTQDYAIQKLLLYYDTPNQWPVAYERSKVPLKKISFELFYSFVLFI